MRIFRYWIKERREGLRDGVQVQGVVYGGSDLSMQAARDDLDGRWQQVLRGAFRGSQSLDQGYESDILEEVVHRYGPDVVVTRNRYGAEILNCKRTVFVDVDWHPRTWREILFGTKKISAEERVRRTLPFFQKVVSQRVQGIRGIRVYETPRGMRVVLNCGSSDPRSPEVQAAMNAVHSDHLYQILCEKQNCFRARLTAKPSRMQMRSLNQIWPVDQELLIVRQAWVAEYRANASKYAACRYLETIGEASRSEAIELHDSLSGALSGKPLA